MTDYKLWGRAGWGSTIVEAQLVWYGLPFTFEPVERPVPARPTRDAKLEKVNPLAQVPTLVMPDGSDHERECRDHPAARRHHRQGLAGAAGRRAGARRSSCAGWCSSSPTSIRPSPTPTIRRASSSVNAARDPFRAATDAYAQRLWRQIESEAGSPWFLGERFSRARHLHRRHDALAAQARLVRERDAQAVRHRPPRRPGAGARRGVEAQLPRRPEAEHGLRRHRRRPGRRRHGPLLREDHRGLQSARRRARPGDRPCRRR